jgi:AraC-like DNA-binding protein/mannose-6-phosphate isomerase-like protein (cupin superfamily)
LLLYKWGGALIKLDYLDKSEFQDIPLLKMVDNKSRNLPFFIRKYTVKDLTTSFHRHEYMQINYIYQGSGKHLVNHGEFTIVKGDIFIIPPYIPHCIIASPDSSIIIFELEFEPGFVNQNFGNIENTRSFFDFAYIEPFLVHEGQVKPRLNLNGKFQVEIETMLDEALQEYKEQKSGYQLLIKALLLKLLVQVGREFVRDLENSESRPIYDRHRDAIFGALKFIEEHYDEELSVEDVAKKFILSQSYFSYLFKSITAKTFTEYLNRLRISKSLELLKNTDQKVLDICYQVGFNNVNHFNRIFRQQIGVSPLRFRKIS